MTKRQISEVVFKENKKVGELISTKALIEKIASDSIFHEESGGGVTFSGGEPMAQPEFLFEILKECKKRNIHTCVDTAGSLKTPNLDEICKFTDLFLFDLKTANEEIFKKYIGHGFELVFQNLQRIKNNGNQVLIRIPIIPTINDNETELEEICDRLNNLNIDKIELMPYHRTGSDKYNRLGREYEMAGHKSLTNADILPLKKYLSNKGFIIV